MGKEAAVKVESCECCQWDKLCIMCLTNAVFSWSSLSVGAPRQRRGAGGSQTCCIALGGEDLELLVRQRPVLALARLGK
eukprot:scaffold132406_cov27-Tisochrysis_lutea.AAC.5